VATTESARTEQARSTTSTGIRIAFLLRSVGLKTLWDERRSILWWSGGTAILSAIVILLWPSIAAGPELEELIERLPPALQAMMGENIDLTSVPGYLNLRLFTFIAPIIFLVYAIGRGTAAVAGEEDRGTMDVLLSHPVERWRIVVEKFTTMLFGLIVVGLALWVGLVLGALAVNVDLNISRAAQATFMVILLGMFHGALALAIGAGTGRTGLATGIAATVGIAGYFLHTLAPLVDWLEPFQVLSPFYYYIEDPAIMQRMNTGHAVVLVVLSLILLLTGVLSFQQRDVQV
jgi:ABC-2 type transport system permease protein